MWINRVFLTSVIFASSVCTAYKVCATSRYAPECTQLQRGNSEVTCQYVQDSIECANRIRNGTAHFGKFSAESVAHLATMGWPNLTIIKELRHKTRPEAPINFEVVVLVRKNHKGGLIGTKRKGYCHRGLYYGKAQRWTEHFLKYFERQTVPWLCNNHCSNSIVEKEVLSVSDHFDKACRPGIWSHDRVEDAKLKKKYSNLCELCDNKASCSYLNNDVSQVFECLGQGDNVAFVSFQEALKYDATYNLSSQYSYLCPDGSLQRIKNNSNPCSWIKEPWDMIIASSPKARELGKMLDQWMQSSGGSSWQTTLFNIIIPSDFRMVSTTIQHPADQMLGVGRGAAPKIMCRETLSWCTISQKEKEKCEVARAGAITTGVQPLIECSAPFADTVGCLSAIRDGRSDFMGLDSNFRYLARSLYGLTAALYFETEADQYSSVVAVVHAASNYKNFESLRGARACIPEFGGTASMAFVNIGKYRGFMSRNEYRYGYLMSTFFGDSCAPGANDYKHQRTTDMHTSLCKLCNNALTTEAPEQFRMRKGFNVNITGTPSTVRDECSAGDENPYYGNDGALRCLSQGGDVAIVEMQSLQDHAHNLNISEHDYRIICRNGSLAANTGFDVDAECALTSIVDGEVIVKRGSDKINSIINALSSMDSYFQVNPDFEMYNIYDGQKHLLFKDSTIGLIGYNEEDLPKRVQSYKQLFEYIESCKQGNSATAPTITGFMTMLVSVVMSMYLAL